MSDAQGSCHAYRGARDEFAAIMQQVLDCSSRVLDIVIMYAPHAYTQTSIEEMFLVAIAVLDLCACPYACRVT
jgi:hypothetical protein